MTGGITYDTPADSPAVTNATNSPEPVMRTGFKFKVKQPVRQVVASSSESDDE
jgi:hypothetical protein